MGFDHSSAPLSDAGKFCASQGRVAGLAAEHFPLKNRGPLGRAAVWALRAGIHFYQATLAPLMPLACKFHPSCSHYASEAIARHGALRGLRLAAWRVLRCGPFTQGGHDPVPEADLKPVPDNRSSSGGEVLL